MASTARLYIYVGLGLLVSALLLSFASMYSRPVSRTFVHRLSVSGNASSLELFSLLSGVDNIVNTTVVLSYDGGCCARLLVIKPRGTVAVSETLEPGARVTLHPDTLDSLVLSSNCTGVATLMVSVEARRYPLMWLGLPAFALLVAGSAVLGLGAVLRLAGLEEE